MKFKMLLITIALIILLLSFCSVKENGVNGEGSASLWLISEDEIRDGGPGKDGIPALTNPAFTALSRAGYLKDDDLVVGIKMGSMVRAYPHAILNWHEIINDQREASFFTLSYCPLTGSAMGWHAIAGSGDKTFGVSGLLYNSNLILYDRRSDSNWSQMLYLCVNGELKGEIPAYFPVVETTWATWKSIYPQSRVLSTETGFSRDYLQYPYGDYKTSDRLLFPANNADSRLAKKERVLGIEVERVGKVYPIKDFGDAIKVVNDAVNGVEVVVAGSSSRNLAVAFGRKLSGGTILTFSPVTDHLPIIMLDNEGNAWDLFGLAQSGPRTGEQLPVVKSFISYWFAWTAFYPTTDIALIP